MNYTYFFFFLCIIICTLIITHWAAKRDRTTSQFYAASGHLTGFQNGLAIAGDYISAASFLGITGAISLHGYDGFLYSIGFLVSYLIVLFLIAEPVKNLGKYSLGDVICARFPSHQIRLLMAGGTFFISIFYMIPQLVASGLLIRLLLGIDYSISVLVIGSLMTVYVVLGGMVATSWVQIVKTVLLMSGTFLVSLMVLARFDWQVLQLIEYVKQGTPLGTSFFYPGNLFDDFLEMFSLKLALLLGTAGLPHILIRFYTVKNTLEVRRSVITATWIIGIFYIMTLVLGLGTIALVGMEKLTLADPTGNLAAPLLAKELGGDFLLAFISALAFTTIVAVVTGLVISATISLSHDVYHHIYKKGKATDKEQLRVAKWTAVGIGMIATLFSLGLENINVTFLVSLTFVIAASTNLPVILLTIYWKRFNQHGVLVGMLSGFLSSVLLVLLGPHIMNIDNGWIAREALLPIYNPGIIAIPIGFLGAILGTIFSKEAPDDQKYFRLLVKAHTGIDTRRNGWWNL
ncbi:cation acetate symporter [Siminovitchia acidinfaciens]|uniref:Cation acetate symporter n=1 Tax=Siminovitchia acidinfaciens TaxID=2321395 RepID=A0A429XX75_9BACI|nr:cation acetate symporter [Siminovitchia acidinfaciens]RST73099.1 cation acetate symporter [Siminovitchia acidinfaciens]